MAKLSRSLSYALVAFTHDVCALLVKNKKYAYWLRYSSNKLGTGSRRGRLLVQQKVDTQSRGVTRHLLPPPGPKLPAGVGEYALRRKVKMPSKRMQNQDSDKWNSYPVQNTASMSPSSGVPSQIFYKRPSLMESGVREARISKRSPVQKSSSGGTSNEAVVVSRRRPKRRNIVVNDKSWFPQTPAIPFPQTPAIPSPPKKKVVRFAEDITSHASDNVTKSLKDTGKELGELLDQFEKVKENIHGLEKLEKEVKFKLSVTPPHANRPFRKALEGLYKKIREQEILLFPAAWWSVQAELACMEDPEDLKKLKEETQEYSKKYGTREYNNNPNESFVILMNQIEFLIALVSLKSSSGAGDLEKYLDKKNQVFAPEYKEVAYKVSSEAVKYYIFLPKANLVKSALKDYLEKAVEYEKDTSASSLSHCQLKFENPHKQHRTGRRVGRQRTLFSR